MSMWPVLLHELFSGNQSLLNQELRQCVGLRKTGDKKFFHRDWSLIRYYHFWSSLVAVALGCNLDRVVLSQLQRL